MGLFLNGFEFAFTRQHGANITHFVYFLNSVMFRGCYEVSNPSFTCPNVAEHPVTPDANVEFRHFAIDDHRDIVYACDRRQDNNQMRCMASDGTRPNSWLGKTYKEALHFFQEYCHSLFVFNLKMCPSCTSAWPNHTSSMRSTYTQTQSQPPLTYTSVSSSCLYGLVTDVSIYIVVISQGKPFLP